MFSRYRNLAVLVHVVAAQLILVAYQVRTSKDVTLLRAWTVTAVSPLAKGLEVLRSSTLGLAERYFLLVGVNQENLAMRAELDRFKLENQFLKTELSTADRARSLSVFQEHSRSRTVAARVIGTGTGANSKVVFIDRVKSDGVVRGMAVITPDGIVGKITFVFPHASQVLLVTDPTFAAGVISQKNRVPGTLKGLGRSQVQVDWVQNEVKVEEGSSGRPDSRSAFSFFSFHRLPSVATIWLPSGNSRKARTTPSTLRQAAGGASLLPFARRPSPLWVPIAMLPSFVRRSERTKLLGRPCVLPSNSGTPRLTLINPEGPAKYTDPSGASSIA